MTDIQNGEESLPLKMEIARQIQECGPIPFSRFMELCLYHPQYGYYTSTRTRIGKQGDFFTSSSVHSLFGRLIARQVAEIWTLLGEGPFVLVEQGAGEGFLCLDLLDALAEEYPGLYAQLEYRIVEVSADHRARQQETLASHRSAGRILWCEFEELQPFRGCFLTNELVDAFPVHIVEKRDGFFHEVLVDWQDESFCEVSGDPSDPLLETYFQDLEIPLLEGNRAEVNLEAAKWMSRVGQLLEQGAVLTIDYGYPARELLAPWRRTGTLLCYHRHQSSDNPFQHVGCQDITAHINFTQLENAGAEQGLETLYFGEQYRFLMGLGFVEELMKLQACETDPKCAQALRMTLKNLIMPDGGMGESFKVLIQGKQLGQPTLKCARTLAEISLPAETG